MPGQFLLLLLQPLRVATPKRAVLSLEVNLPPEEEDQVGRAAKISFHVLNKTDCYLHNLI